MSLKLAHLILAHNRPAQLERLISRLQHPDAHIYIHLDAKSLISDYVFLQKFENVFFTTKRTAISWGTYSMVQATLDSMEEILLSKIAYSHINLLSAQDYPLKSANEIHNYMNANVGKSFLDSQIIGEEWEEGRYRVENYNYGDYKFPGHYLLQYMVNVSRIKKPKPKNLFLLGRSQWMTITPEAVSYVLETLKAQKKLKRYFRMSFAPDEFIFQTLLGSSYLKDTLVNDNLRYIEFLKGAHHPTMLNISDAMMLTTTTKLYARKFDPDQDHVIMNYLDWIAKFGVDFNSPQYKCFRYIFNNQKAPFEELEEAYSTAQFKLP